MSQVFRVERTKNYTVMDNYHLKDKRLSLKAKGLLSVIITLLTAAEGSKKKRNTHCVFAGDVIW